MEGAQTKFIHTQTFSLFRDLQDYLFNRTNCLFYGKHYVKRDKHLTDKSTFSFCEKTTLNVNKIYNTVK